MLKRRHLSTEGEEKTPISSSEEINGFLGKETVFEGKLAFQGVFRLEGKFDGEIFESGTLIVGESAAIKGKIEAHTIIIHGRVDGDIHARERAEVHQTGRLYGNLHTPILIINEGGIFDGNCKMEGVLPKENDFHHPSHKVNQTLSA